MPCIESSSSSALLFFSNTILIVFLCPTPSAFLWRLRFPNSYTFGLSFGLGCGKASISSPRFLPCFLRFVFSHVDQIEGLWRRAMSVKPKRKTMTENGDTGGGGGGGGGDDSALANMVSSWEDLGPMVRFGFEIGKPESLLQQLKKDVIKKEVEIEELCKLHYEEFISVVDELRGVLVDADLMVVVLV